MRRNAARYISRTFLLVAALGLVAGCGKPTIEGAVAGYKTAKDKLDALTAKVSPQMKVDIRAKVAEFEKDFKAAEAKGGEQAITAINALTRRVNKYRTAIDPKAGKKATTNAGRKLNQGATPVGTKAPRAAPVRTGTKLAPKGTAPAPAARPAPAPAKGSSGFGGKAAPAPRPAAPAPRPAAPAPKPATGGSGFGGK